MTEPRHSLHDLEGLIGLVVAAVVAELQAGTRPADADSQAAPLKAAQAASAVLPLGGQSA
jgi:hypothetical protein